MRCVQETCVPREEVLKGDLEDALFAADFGHVIEGRAPSVYLDPKTFFRNTHPAAHLVKIMQVVFDRLSNPAEPGALLRLSTGFGGGKTHALIAMWHLAHNAGDRALGHELVPPDKRPAAVRVVGVDGDKLGYPIARQHDDASPRSLWGELAYQLGGKALLAEFQQCDDAESAPTADLLRKALDRGDPVLILLDELVKYMVKVPERAQKNIVAFVGQLSNEIRARRQTVLIITDPAQQKAYAEEAAALASDRENRAAGLLDDELSRTFSGFDPIGEDSARVITRRLFESVDSSAAEEAAQQYVAAYRRMIEANPDILPSTVATDDYARRIRECYPFHPRLVETAQDRLGALAAFNRSRGTLRLFARILRQIWEARIEVSLITAGDVDVTAERIQSDLIYRLNRDPFRAVVSADCRDHASALDEEYGADFHRRVARALLIESLPMNTKATMDKREIALTTLRPSDVGNEPGEALDRLLAVGWYIYPDGTGTRFQFRVEPNVNKRIEETADRIPLQDADSEVLAHVQQHYAGSAFKLVAYPGSSRAVSDTAELKLVLCDSENMAKSICEYTDASDPAAPERRRFRNAILALAPTDQARAEAARLTRRVRAAEQLRQEAHRADPRDELLLQQLDKLLPTLRKQARMRACRAFNRVVFHSRPSVTLEEKYLVPEDSAIGEVKGQESVKRFLDEKGLIFQPNEALDLDILCNELLKGATPSTEHEGAFTASSVHERALESARLRLMRDAEPVRKAVQNAVQEGRLVVRLPDGRCYDRDGMVSGPPNARVRSEEKLLTLPMTRDVLIAPADAPCAKSWFAVTEEGRSDSDIPPPPPARPVATDWATAIEYAGKHPLLRLKLHTTAPKAGAVLQKLAQPFSARRLTVTLYTQGELKDGGSVVLSIENAKPTSAVRPLPTAETLLRSLKEDADYRAELLLEFPEGGAEQAADRLTCARDQAGSDVEVEAQFGEEAS